jgi:hypothetical protein
MSAVDCSPFADVRVIDDGFSLPELKWRELLFIGALRKDGDAYVRDPDRPLPEFAVPGLFPRGRRFRAALDGRRVLIRPEVPGARV